jgi:hypothetical protein
MREGAAMPEEQRIELKSVDGGHLLKVGKTAVHLTDSDVLQLSRLFPTYLRRLLESRRPSDSTDVVPIAPVPTTDFAVNEDLHQTQVHLTIKDSAGGDFDFALEPPQARTLAERLISRAAGIEFDERMRHRAMWPKPGDPV